jgi:hypothetical protein
VLIATRHGVARGAALIVLVALSAWAARLAIPSTSAAAPTVSCAGTLPWRARASSRRRPANACRSARCSVSRGSGSLVPSTCRNFRAMSASRSAAKRPSRPCSCTVFAVGIAAGSLLCNRLLGVKVSARIVPWGALGIGLFSIDLWLASPASVAAEALVGLGPFLGDPAHWRILVDLFGIAVSGGIFVVPLYALLQAASERQRRAQTIAAKQRDQCRGDGRRPSGDDGIACRRRQRPGAVSADRHPRACRRSAAMEHPAEVRSGSRIERNAVSMISVARWQGVPAPGSRATSRIRGSRRRFPAESKAAAPRRNPPGASRRGGTTARRAAGGPGR